MSLKESEEKEENSAEGHFKRCYDWIAEIGISSHRGTIVYCITQKLESMFPVRVYFERS